MKRLWIGGAAVVLLALILIVWFQPHKLFIDDTVNEAAPTNTAQTSDSSAPNSTQAHATTVAGPPTSAAFPTGAFRPLNHQASGKARLIALADGSYTLRLEELDVENGPDLRVYLSAAPASSATDDVFDDVFVDLGALKGNQGSQNYEVVPGTDITRFTSAVIWCRRFSTGFAVAPLT